MGSIFGGTAQRGRAVSDRQKKYLHSTKGKWKVKKHEQSMQFLAAEWTRATFPGVHFYSDTGSGSFSSNYEKEVHNRQQSAKGLPDMNIFAARHGYHGLVLELKPEGTELKMKRDGRVARVYKNGSGKIIYRDLAPRKKGDWKDFHTERQHTRQLELREAGYFSCFVIGLEQYKKVLCWYMGKEYIPPAENLPLPF